MNSNKQAVEAAVLTLEALREAVGRYDLPGNPNHLVTKIDSVLPALRAELARPLEVAAPVTDAEIERATKLLNEQAAHGFVLESLVRSVLEQAANRAPVALGAVPVGYTAPWWIDMKGNGTIVKKPAGKWTEPVYSAPPTQGDAKDAAGYCKKIEALIQERDELKAAAKDKHIPLTEEQKRKFIGSYFAEDWSSETALIMLNDFESKHGITQGGDQ